ncbi:MAG: sulfatase-like hydrolase/transferase [Candidatus Thorarchaeota archaeon]
MSEKTNILFIFTDQHRGDTLGSVGHPVIKTPNLDKLAKEGVVFRRCYTNSPLCVPARSTLASGLYVNQHGSWDNDFPADRNGPSHIRNIRDAGYLTALIGKSHLLNPHRGHVKEVESELHDWGYENVMAITSTVNNGTLKNAWSDHLAEKGLDEIYFKSIREFLRLNWTFQRKPWEDPPAPIPTEDHVDNFVGQKGVEWIKNYNDDRPFYLQVCFPGPHPPFNSAPEYRALYKPEEMPIGILQLPGKPYPEYTDFVIKWSNLGEMTPEQMQIMRTYYYAKITMIDERIGDIIRALEAKGILDDTWIIYSADHGENLGDHRLNQKVVFFESAVHIPLIIRPPGGVERWQTHALTDLLDVTATLLEIANAKSLKNCEGISLLSKIRAGPSDPAAQKGKDVIFSEVYGYSMVFDGRFKLVANARTSELVEMIDLKEDPQELSNKFNDPSLLEIRNKLFETYLKHFLKKTDLKKLSDLEKRRERRRKIIMKQVSIK